MEENAVIQRTKRKKSPLVSKRPYIVEVIGVPDAGKSMLIKELLKLFETVSVGIVAIGFNQDKDSETDLVVRGLHQCLEILKNRKSYAGEILPQIHELASVVFRAIFKVNAIRAQTSLHDVVLLEHGPYFTWIVEKNWAKVSESTLTEDVSGVAEPDLVIYLPVTPAELRSRHTKKRILLDVEASARIYEALEDTAKRKKWVRVARLSTPAETAEKALGEILCRYRGHLENLQPPKQFSFH